MIRQNVLIQRETIKTINQIIKENILQSPSYLDIILRCIYLVSYLSSTEAGAADCLKYLRYFLADLTGLVAPDREVKAGAEMDFSRSLTEKYLETITTTVSQLSLSLISLSWGNVC